MKPLKHKPIVTIVTLGVVVIAASASWAMTNSSGTGPVGTNGRVNGCYSRTGALRVASPGASCGKGTALTWVGTNPNAVVFSDGTLLHGSGVSQITHQPGSGVYDVYFNYDQAGSCAQVASLADMTPGTIAAYGGQVAPNVVQVQTGDTTGASADRTFQLSLSC